MPRLLLVNHADYSLADLAERRPLIVAIVCAENTRITALVYISAADIVRSAVRFGASG